MMIPVLVCVCVRACESANMRCRWRWSGGVSLGHLTGCLERYADATIHFWTSPTKTRHPHRWISSTMIPGTGRDLLPIMKWRRTWQSFDGGVFHRSSHWLGLLVSRTRCRTFEMTTCDTPVITSLWERQQLDNWTMSSSITDRILFGMIDGNLHTRTAECDRHKCNILHLAQLQESKLPRKRLTRTGQKVMVERNTFLRCLWKRAFISIRIYFHQLRGKMGAGLGWFQEMAGSVLYMYAILQIIRI